MHTDSARNSIISADALLCVSLSWCPSVSVSVSVPGGLSILSISLASVSVSITPSEFVALMLLFENRHDKRWRIVVSFAFLHPSLSNCFPAWKYVPQDNKISCYSDIPRCHASPSRFSSRSTGRRKSRRVKDIPDHSLWTIMSQRRESGRGCCLRTCSGTAWLPLPRVRNTVIIHKSVTTALNLMTSDVPR